jgi:glutamate dehydrogenase/leucine dehydrogenase
MTEEHIKEAISLRYMELIAAYNGYTTDVPSQDYGVDLEIKEIGQRQVDNKYTPTGRSLSFQIKATTNNSIIIESNLIKYDLSAKNYNDLVQSINQ